MRERGYYSVRTGSNPNGGRLDIRALKRMFLAVYGQLSEQGYFQQALGYQCTDAGYVPGTLGSDVEASIFLALYKENIWPISKENLEAYTEDDLFDVIEFLFDYVSKPVDGYYHSWNDCGMHYSTFNKAEGKQEYLSRINQVLGIYGDGYILSDEGEILTKPEQGMSPLLEADLPKLDPDNVEGRVRAATALFRKRKSSLEDRKHAVRDLADVLEYLRPQIQSVLTSKDESDLFNIANSFAIRHHNDKQKTDYDTAGMVQLDVLFLPSYDPCLCSYARKEKTRE